MKKLLINGFCVQGIEKRQYTIYNPATHERITSVSEADEQDIDVCVKSSKAAFEKWSKVTTKERALIIHNAAALLRTEYFDEVVNCITNEMGKPKKSSISEVSGAADLLDYFAEEGLRITGEIPHLNLQNQQLLIIKEPVGVVAAITPSNYPLSLLVWKLGPALITGCCLISKPDEYTPSAALLLGELFLKAGLPNGVFNVITGGGKVGEALVRHKDIDKISFTGSLEIGKKIASIASETCKRVSLELGGSCPAIIMDDVDIEEVVADVVKHAFNNTGQYCYRISRAYIQDNIYVAFKEALIEKVSQLKVGNGLKDDVNLGPLTKTKTLLKYIEFIEDAKQNGGKICYGGNILNKKFKKSLFVEPTIIESSNHNLKVFTDETFSPILPLFKIKGISEGIKYANSSEYGLAAYIFTKDIGIGIQASKAIKAGSVWLNRIYKAYEVMPFGGMKKSGYGREKSKFGLDEYLELKSIYITLPNIEIE